MKPVGTKKMHEFDFPVVSQKQKRRELERELRDAEPCRECGRQPYECAADPEGCELGDMPEAMPVPLAMYCARCGLGHTPGLDTLAGDNSLLVWVACERCFPQFTTKLVCPDCGRDNGAPHGEISHRMPDGSEHRTQTPPYVYRCEACAKKLGASYHSTTRVFDFPPNPDDT